jgi:hypothetical protein
MANTCQSLWRPETNFAQRFREFVTARSHQEWGDRVDQTTIFVVDFVDIKANKS